MVADILPSPLEAQKIRLSRLWEPTSTEGEIGQVQQQLKESMAKCNGGADAPVLAFVSKVFPVEKDALSYISNPNQRRESSAFLSGEQGETFVAMARIFSGTLRKGQEIEILGPRYNPSDPQKHRSKMTVEHLFLLMGRSISPIESVPAGNVFGIGSFTFFICSISFVFFVFLV
jgi:ribosome assembly protein 1